MVNRFLLLIAFKLQYELVTLCYFVGKKLFFHLSEVKDNATLQPNDAVEFVLITNQRTGKSSACNVAKM